MNRLLRFLFFGVAVRTVVLLLLGLNVRHRERLPLGGPAILVANHNSHLDTMVLISLLPLKLLPRIRPAAALDYFLRNRPLAWFALNIIGIIPVARKAENPTPAMSCRAAKPVHPLQGCKDALERGDILIFFPEGTRGEPEQRAKFKSGIAHLIENHPDVPVIPIFMHGLGKSLPRGETVLVPFFCDVFVGEALHWNGSRVDFMLNLEQGMEALEAEGGFAEWE
ncbi:MAG: lysophospholipid acyltransferase family protein [Candidatus Methylumidiphilus sp.]